MERKSIELYDEQEVAKMRLTNKIWTVAVSVFAAACLVACIILCCLVNVRNVRQLQTIVMTIVVVGGWIIIYVCVSILAENKHEIVHARNMLEGERSEYIGELSLGKDKIKILGSITVVKAILKDGDKEQKFNVNLLKTGKLKNLEGKVKLYVVHGYVVALEVSDENS